ncbi:tRNA (adenosine(37)-N6)-dimethylallyltransferase MiaA [Maribacter sp. MMG018]|uniref:tRNA (adenosine(37)-N6)-dimethylallyltransferase MiaA n=1 Tax=Maribacter sp. MMG018 TaxID=2822688 RepID=UPI001B37F63D|nr:tRNA (adenosine(37)-N6)-dimethylallyltransferase MiaA [Maribacter sp. MMG018]MBQ4914921.1 tRNA (adenosine(37)-N6)-dimethylallyltransferase MiaA [Maribacter sp. MMG018]
MNKVLISVVGPTAIGKTRMGIVLANHFNTEIISADSRQFYKEMSIGTAVPSDTELKSAKHHFIQHKRIHDTYTVGDFEKDALDLLDEIFKKKDIVVMVGGSGLYVDAVTSGLNKFPKVDEVVRKELNQEFDKNGIESLQHKLQKLDPTYYKKVDINNPHRLIRALEICIGTGKPYSGFLEKPKDQRNFKVLQVGLIADRSIIYDRINQRVDIMMQSGLLEEAKALLKFKDLNALQTVGYKELFEYLSGVWDLDFAISEVKKNTRRFAKRQLTWFKKKPDTLWIAHDYQNEDMITMVNKALLKLNDEE